MASSSVLKTPTDKTGPKICTVSAYVLPDVCGDGTHLFFDLRDEREISPLLIEPNGGAHNFHVRPYVSKN